jgi:hypothetical protein
MVSPRSNGGFQNSVDDDCKPYKAATSSSARTTATTAGAAGAITITIFSPKLLPITSHPNLQQTA